MINFAPTSRRLTSRSSSKACAPPHSAIGRESTLRARTVKSLPYCNITCRRVASRPLRHTFECKFYVHRSIYLFLCSSTYRVLCSWKFLFCAEARRRELDAGQGRVMAGHAYCKSTVWARREEERRSI